MVRGNHDFWWSSLTQVRAAMPDGMYVLQNDSLEMDGIIVLRHARLDDSGRRGRSPAGS